MSTPGARRNDATEGVAVTDDPEQERYEIRVDGELAGFAAYRSHERRRTFTHTEIDDRHEGEGLGSELVRRALEDVRRQGLQVVPVCPFVKSYLGRHEEFLDLVEPRLRAAYGL